MSRRFREAARHRAHREPLEVDSGRVARSGHEGAERIRDGCWPEVGLLSTLARRSHACRRRVGASLNETVDEILAPFAEEGSHKRRGGRERERAKERAERKTHRARVEHVRLSSESLPSPTRPRARPLRDARPTRHNADWSHRLYVLRIEIPGALAPGSTGASLVPSARAVSRLARPRPVHWTSSLDALCLPFPPRSHMRARIRLIMSGGANTGAADRRPLPTNKDDLWLAVKEEWAKLDLAKIRSLYDTYDHRIQALVDAEGGHTRY
jgi:hypothetical protein